MIRFAPAPAASLASFGLETILPTNPSLAVNILLPTKTGTPSQKAILHNALVLYGKSQNKMLSEVEQ